MVYMVVEKKKCSTREGYAVGAKRIFLQLNCYKSLYHQSRKENKKITVNIVDPWYSGTQCGM